MGSNVEYLLRSRLWVGHVACVFTLISHNPRRFLFLVKQLRPKVVKKLAQCHLAGVSASERLIREAEPLGGVWVCVCLKRIFIFDNLASLIPKFIYSLSTVPAPGRKQSRNHPPQWRWDSKTGSLGHYKIVSVWLSGGKQKKVEQTTSQRVVVTSLTSCLEEGSH